VVINNTFTQTLLESLFLLFFPVVGWWVLVSPLHHLVYESLNHPRIIVSLNLLVNFIIITPFFELFMAHALDQLGTQLFKLFRVKSRSDLRVNILE